MKFYVPDSEEMKAIALGNAEAAYKSHQNKVGEDDFLFIGVIGKHFVQFIRPVSRKIYGLEFTLPSPIVLSLVMW